MHGLKIVAVAVVAPRTRTRRRRRPRPRYAARVSPHCVRNDPERDLCPLQKRWPGQSVLSRTRAITTGLAARPS
jgi:hypothetical protein